MKCPDPSACHRLDDLTWRTVPGRTCNAPENI
jgi:hypothetical protein